MEFIKWILLGIFRKCFARGEGRKILFEAINEVEKEESEKGFDFEDFKVSVRKTLDG